MENEYVGFAFVLVELSKFSDAAYYPFYRQWGIMLRSQICISLPYYVLIWIHTEKAFKDMQQVDSFLDVRRMIHSSMNISLLSL